MTPEDANSLFVSGGTKIKTPYQIDKEISNLKEKQSSNKKSILKDVFDEFMATDETVGMYGTGDFKDTEKYILDNKTEMDLMTKDGISKKDIKKYANEKQEEWELERAEEEKIHAEIYDKRRK